MVTQNMLHEIIRMGIHTEVELLSGSDHVALRFDINLVGGYDQPSEPQKNSFFLSESRDMNLAKREMDRMLSNVDWDNLSLETAGERLTKILIDSNINCYNTARRKVRRPRNIFKLKRLKQQRKELDRREKQLSLEKIKRAIAKEEWSLEEQGELDAAVKESQAVHEKINIRWFELKSNTTQKLRLRASVKN